jgi:ubiquinone/menaquinone biosynthesis C-methylase UbiE
MRDSRALCFSSGKIVGVHGRVYAVDILHTALETINRRIKLDQVKNVETIWSNLEIFQATKIESGKLDVGLLLNTLYLSNKRPEIIRESVRMIKKGGHLVVVEWEGVDIPFGPPIEERVKKDLLIKIAEKSGLHLEEEFIAGQYHYGLIFVK